MNRTTAPGLLMRLTLIVMAIAGMAALIAVLDSAAARRGAATHETMRVMIAPAGPPIAAEADVFRSAVHSPAAAYDSDDPPRRAAHPRTLATYRALRAYPGAPPRIPHGLTSDEFRTTTCNTCHERGGYAPRFDAYAPVTPHAERTDCLQCHLADARLAGVPLPGTRADDICRQCHAPSRQTPAGARAWADIDWRPAAWPALHHGAQGEPPPIPHTLELRSKCSACHAGLAAIAEIRTTHPERSSCRQCHVLTESTDAVFTRPAVARTDTAGGVP